MPPNECPKESDLLRLNRLFRTVSENQQNHSGISLRTAVHRKIYAASRPKNTGGF